MEKYDVVQSDVSAQTQRLKNAGADVVAVFAIPPQAASMVNTARDTLSWDVPIVVSNINCSDIFVALAAQERGGHHKRHLRLPGVQHRPAGRAEVREDLGQVPERRHRPD